MHRLLTAFFCALLAWTPVAAQVMKLHPAPASGAPVISDVIWTTRGVTQLTLSDSNHTITLNAPFPGFADGVVLPNLSFANGDKRFWGITVNVLTSNADIVSGLALSSIGTTPATLTFGMSHSGAATGSTGGNTFGLAIGTHPALMAWDGSRQAFFIYYSPFGWGGSSGTDDPIAGTGGAIPSSAIGTPLFPGLQLADANDSVTINGGAQAFDATLLAQVAALKAAGYKELGAP